MLIALIIISSLSLVISLYNMFAIQFIVKRVNEIAELKIELPNIGRRLIEIAKKLEEFLQIAK